MIDGVGNEDKEVIGISKAKGSSVDMSFSLLVTLSRYLTQTLLQLFKGEKLPLHYSKNENSGRA